MCDIYVRYDLIACEIFKTNQKGWGKCAKYLGFLERNSKKMELIYELIFPFDNFESKFSSLFD